jgi:hypothetical protein
MHVTTANQGVVQIQVGQLLTKHAAERMRERGQSHAAVAAAITYGRVAHVRGADIHAIGRNEVEFYERDGIDLSRYEGIQVVCSADGSVLTVYRNRNFRGLRPSHGRVRRQRRLN